MDFNLDVIQLFSKLPTSFSLFASTLVLATGLWLKIKNTKFEEKKSESVVQAAQVESLMQHIKLLSDELDKTRKQLSDLHMQNLELMEQLREANKRISELELALDCTPNRGLIGGCNRP